MKPITAIKPITVLVGLLGLGVSVFAQAQAPGVAPLEVVADHGGEPARPYYVAIGTAQVQESEGYHADVVGQAGQTGPVTDAHWLPVESERLSPGHVEARQLELPAGMTPFFLVGDDPLSHKWLEARRDWLVEHHAVGLVVDVADAAGLERLRQQAQGLELRPTSGDDIANRLGLEHYPVAITPQGLSQ